MIFGFYKSQVEGQYTSEDDEYDYVGSKWPPHTGQLRSFWQDPSRLGHTCRTDEEVCGGNGGLSLRTKSAMLEVVSNASFDHLFNVRRLPICVVQGKTMGSQKATGAPTDEDSAGGEQRQVRDGYQVQRKP